MFSFGTASVDDRVQSQPQNVDINQDSMCVKMYRRRFMFPNVMYVKCQGFVMFMVPTLRQLLRVWRSTLNSCMTRRSTKDGNKDLLSFCVPSH